MGKRKIEIIFRFLLQCKNESYDVKFAELNPGFRGYTKSNCLLLQKLKMVTTIYNCTLLYSPVSQQG
jgi:hypothetical protein